jgi:type II secretory pathway pseudopilin PulG
MRATSLRRESGFTIIEVMVAAVVLLVGIIAVLTLLDASSRAQAATRARDAGTNLARELVEASRNVPYEKASAPGISGELQRLPGLADSSPGGVYTVSRRNTLYTVSIDVCVMDDPKDGGGPRASTATFCASSAPAGTADKNPEDYKRVTVNLTWERDGYTTRLRQTGLLNNPGSASGPAVRTIVPRGYAPPYVVSSDVSTVTVDLTTSSVPATVGWLLDGTRQPGAVTRNGPTGLAWQFDWPVGLLDDGAYIVSAEAFDQFGVSGPGRQETVILNRFAPRRPTRVTGGRTQFGTVEIEWSANSERDVVGYQVFRVGQTTPVCPIETQQLDTVCTDTSPPGDAELVYYVRAYDKDTSGNPRASSDSLPVRVTTSNSGPYPVTSLSLAALANGSVKLTWKRPSPEDPDAGDSASFFRIYRDGKALVNRYDRYFDDTGATTVSWTDLATGGTKHTYWVTTVDQHYAESSFVGPVGG